MRRPQICRAHRCRPAPAPAPAIPPHCLHRRLAAAGRGGPWRGGGCGAGSRRVYFQVPSLWPRGWGAGAAVTGPGCARSGAGDAARRGPGCAALQLSWRRRPRAPTPAQSQRSLPFCARPPALSAVPTLPGLGVSRLRAPSRRCARPSAPATLSSTGLSQRGDPPGLPWVGGLEAPLVITPTPRPRPSFRGRLLFVFVIGKVPTAAIRWGGGGDQNANLCPLFFQPKARPDSEDGVRVGVFWRRRKLNSVGFIWAGMCFFGKMDGSRCPRRDAAQCSSITASLVLAGGAWHGRSAPAAPARPHPGPGLPLAEA